MKRFTLILASLFLSLGAVNAQEVYVTNLNDLSNEKTYLIESARCVLINSANVTSGLATTNGTAVGTVARSIDDANQQFKIEKDGENYYLYSVGAGKYVTDGGAWADEMGTALTITDVSGENAGYPWKLSLGSTYLNSQDPNQTVAGIIVDTWSTTDAGNCYRIIDIEATKALETVDVTYVYYLNGVKKHEAVKTQEVGSAYEAPAIDYLTFAYPEGSVTKETTTVDVVCSHALPFELSESYADAKWYYMTIRSSNQKYVARSESAPYANSTNITMGENGRWAFMGNVFDGIKVYNNGAGENQTLGCDATTTESHVYMKEGETSWIIESGNGGFLLRQSGANEYIHDYGSKLEIWNNASASSDAGSAFIVYDAEQVEADYASNWVEEVLATIDLGYVGAYAAELKDEIEAITTYDEVLAFESSHSPLAVNTDSYYRLVCVSPKTGNGGDTSYNTLTFDGSENLVTAPESASSINQIFKFEDAGDGKFYLKSMNADGYLNKISAGSYRSSIVSQTDACKIELINYSGVQWRLYNSESNNSKHCLFAENHPTETVTVPYACAGWENGANSASAWYIVPATDIEIAVNTYASVYLPFAVSVEGATAYAVENTNDTYVTLTEKSDIPANKGAILATEGEATVTLNILAEAESDWTNNKLQGSTIDTYVEGVAYVLANGNNGIGLYKTMLNVDGTGATGETHFKNNANKAYLPAVAGASNVACYSFRFGEGTTGIEEITDNREQSTVIYDLTGRRVEAITAPGIYVVGGRKVLVK